MHCFVLCIGYKCTRISVLLVYKILSILILTKLSAKADHHGFIDMYIDYRGTTYRSFDDTLQAYRTIL